MSVCMYVCTNDGMKKEEKDQQILRQRGFYLSLSGR